MLNMLLASNVRFLEALESDLFLRLFVYCMLDNAKAALADSAKHLKVIDGELSRWLFLLDCCDGGFFDDSFSLR